MAAAVTNDVLHAVPIDVGDSDVFGSGTGPAPCKFAVAIVQQDLGQATAGVVSVITALIIYEIWAGQGC